MTNFIYILGKAFEGKFKSACLSDYKYNVVLEEASENEDFFEGTDFWVEGYRVDLTFNQNKDFVAERMEKTFTVKKMSYYSLQFGVRTGNKAGEFDEPVLVLFLNGVIDDLWLKEHLTEVAEAVKETLTREVWMEGFNFYEDFLDRREALTATP